MVTWATTGAKPSPPRTDGADEPHVSEPLGVKLKEGVSVDFVRGKQLDDVRLHPHRLQPALHVLHGPA